MPPLNPHRRLSRPRLIAFAVIAFSVSACGGPSEERAPVYKTSGKISFEGKPLAGALVLFRQPEADPNVPSPSGTTGEDGTFSLHTYEPDDGAPAGDYLVAVTVRPLSRDSGVKYTLPGEKKAEVPDAIRQGRYADPKTSGLKATIKPIENTLDPINLNSTGGASSSGSSQSRNDR
jgi:hypothetical protein